MVRHGSCRSATSKGKYGRASVLVRLGRRQARDAIGDTGAEVFKRCNGMGDVDRQIICLIWINALVVGRVVKPVSPASM